MISASLRDTGVLDEEPIFELLFACVVASVVVCCVVEVFSVVVCVDCLFSSTLPEAFFVSVVDVSSEVVSSSTAVPSTGSATRYPSVTSI